MDQVKISPSPSVEESNDTLPPFLFQKRPIKSCLTHSAISDINAHFKSKKSSSLTSGISTSSYDSNEQTENFYNNVDYDEQIRAPRMSNINHYTYKGKREPSTVSTNTPFSSNTSKDSFVLEDSETTATSTTSSQEDKKYLPANFDLLQSTRRLSAPSNPSPEEDTNAAILSYTTNNYIYERNDKSEQLLKALDNLNSNTTSVEKQHRIKNRSYVANHLSDVNGTDLQQVYQLKKPLIIPAVLRPTEPEKLSPPTSLESQMSESPTTPKVNMKAFPFSNNMLESSVVLNQKKTKEDSLYVATEPTHKHWKPNGFTDHCMKCFDAFGNFFTPQRKRRHHCRFCGLIFCTSCLYKSCEIYTSSVTGSPGQESELLLTISNTSLTNALSTVTSNTPIDEFVSGVMMDEKSRLVIPIFKNLQDDNDLVKKFKKMFKFCKICKDCGSNYSKVLHELNSTNNTMKDEYVFVENPYLRKLELENQLQCSIRGKNNNRDSFIDERQSSITHVPSDWTWSSF